MPNSLSIPEGEESNAGTGHTALTQAYLSRDPDYASVILQMLSKCLHPTQERSRITANLCIFQSEGKATYLKTKGFVMQMNSSGKMQ